MRGAVQMQVTTIGLDIAKNVFSGSRDRCGRESRRSEATPAQPGAGILQSTAALPHRHGGLRHGALLVRRPEFLIVDGAAGLENAIAAVWDGVPMQRCTVHKHRNLLAHAPERLHEEISADYTDMIYAATRQQVEARRKAFIRKWRLKHRAVADSLEEAGDRLFTFTRLPP